MSSRLGKKFARMESRWENLLQEARENDETVVFTEIEDLVETARSATEDAIMGSMATVQELLQRETYGWSEVNTMSGPSNEDATNDSGDDSNDSTPRHDTNKGESFYIGDLFTTMATDSRRNKTEDDSTDSSLKSNPHNLTQIGNDGAGTENSKGVGSSPILTKDK